jgi:two-component sensor histidine kinase
MSELRRQASFSPVAASASAARQVASQTLNEWDLNGAEEATLLVVTELTSNGVRHAKTNLTLTLTYDGNRLRVEMSDQNEQLPVPSPASVHTHRGWGLRLINELSSDWGTIINPDGKTVWVDFDGDKLSGA